jgi:hypothetical protein
MPLTRCHDMRKISTLVLAILTISLVPCSRAQDPDPTPAQRQLAKEKEVKQEVIVNLEKETARRMPRV